MRIGIDARYLSHGLIGGVHTYLANLLPALLEQAQDHAVVLYADTKQPFELHHLPSNVEVRYLPWRNGLSSIANDMLLRRWLARDALDVAHFPANYGFAPRGTRTIITLHDAINVLPLREIIRGHPKNQRTMSMMTYLHLCTKLALRRADLVLTVSRWAAYEIARVSGYDPSRIVVVPHAPPPDLGRIIDPNVLTEVRARYELPRSFVLADALKNPAVLIQAWRKLPPTLRSGRQIVFFARRDPLPVVGEAIARGEARLLLRPSRPDLIALFSMADTFVFPSLIEGFGIPVLEAMACGAPLIASNRGSIPEVAGDAALLVDAEDADALATRLVRVLTDPDETAQLRNRGFARVGQFSWSHAARQVLESYHQVLQMPHTTLGSRRWNIRAQ